MIQKYASLSSIINPYDKFIKVNAISIFNEWLWDNKKGYLNMIIINIFLK
jgi:hypothetical protein